MKSLLAISFVLVLVLPMGMAATQAQLDDAEFTCFPGTCATEDGRMLAVAGANLSTLQGDDVIFDLTISGNSFTVGIFDGDTNSPDFSTGNWDVGTQESLYYLYEDADGDGVDFSVESPVGTWYGNEDAGMNQAASGPGSTEWTADVGPMPNNDWWMLAVDCSSAPVALDGMKHYVFRVQNPDPDAPGANRFKLSTDGVAELVPQAFAVISPISTENDIPIVYPSYPPYVTPSTYDGTWDFFFEVPGSTDSLVIWDGDFDFGHSGCTGDGCDTDDPDTSPTERPPFIHPSDLVVNEAAQGAGDPPDDWHFDDVMRREPNVTYDLFDPNGGVYHNPNPSGDEEWEAFRLSSEQDCDNDAYDGSANADFCVSIPPGLWHLRISGLDEGNEIGLRFPFPLVTRKSPSIGDRVWLDLNKNATQDPGEPDINGAIVKLYRDGGQPVTGEDGDDYFCAGDENPSGCTVGPVTYYYPDPLVGTRTTTPLGIAADGGIKNYDFLNQVADSYWVDVDESTLPPNHFLTTNNEPYTGPVGGNLPYPLGLPPSDPDEDHDMADFGYAPCKECVCVVWGPGGGDPIDGAEVVWWLDLDANTVTIRATLDRAFADTAYGKNSVVTGWPGKGRKFKQIWTSDNLEMDLYDGAGQLAMALGIDLLAPDGTGGYVTAGVKGGDGYCDYPVGTCADFVSSERTSISENLNNIPWTDYENSPLVDANYEGGPSNWIWDTWYEITVDLAAFGEAGFGYPEMWRLHSSPSKTGDPQPECIVWECFDLCP
jgi:hypothetical protein